MTDHIQRHMEFHSDEIADTVDTCRISGSENEQDSVEIIEVASDFDNSASEVDFSIENRHDEMQRSSSPELPLKITEVTSSMVPVAFSDEGISSETESSKELGNSSSTQVMWEDQKSAYIQRDTFDIETKAEAPMEVTITSSPKENISSSKNECGKTIAESQMSNQLNKSVRDSSFLKETATNLTTDQASLEPALEWVSATDVHKRNIHEAANSDKHSQSIGKDNYDIIADDSLIGYLELRRIKPVSTSLETQHVRDASKISAVSKASPVKDLKLTEKVISPSSILEIKYIHSEPFNVRHFGDKKKIMATDKGVKSIKPSVGPLSSSIKIVKPPKINLVEQKLPVASKKDENKIKSKGSAAPKASKVELPKVLEPSTVETQILTRSKGSLTELSTCSPCSSKELKALVPLQKESQPQSIVEKRTTRKSAKPMQSSKDLPSTENSFLPSASVSKTSETEQNVEAATVSSVSDEVSTNSGASCKSSKDESAVQLHKKPKREILLRYQSEMYKENQVESHSPNDESNLKTSEPAPNPDASEALKKDKPNVFNLNKENFNTSSVDVGTSHSCKIVLSRCDEVDRNGPVASNIAMKLKSSLQDCWQKLRSKNTKSFDQSDGNTSIPRAIVAQKRKLDLSDESGKLENLELQSKTAKANSLKPRKNYRCELCDFSTDDKDGFFAHSNNKHTEEEKMYVCDKCDYITSRQSKLISHAKMHALEQSVGEENNEKANVAKRSLGKSSSIAKAACKTLENLQVDDNMISSENMSETILKSPSGDGIERQKAVWRSYRENTERCPFVCKICPFRAHTLSILQAHQKTHEGLVQQFDCKHCSFSAITWTQYVNHQYTHQSSSSELSCFDKKCDFTTSDPEVLKSHRLLHKITPEYICDHCGYTALRKGFLDKHYASKHSEIKKSSSNPRISYRMSQSPKEQPFKCVICWYSAKDSKTLAKHMQVHAKTNSRKFRCGKCPFNTNVLVAFEHHLSHAKDCKSTRRQNS